jgi:RecA-family ATPase
MIPKTNLGGNRKTSWNAKQIAGEDLGEVQWLIEHIMPQGFFFLAGKPKMRKSFMALQMSLAVVSGGKFLGYDVMQPGRVLYLSLEDNARRIKKRMQNMGIENDMKGLELLEIEERWDRLNKGGLEKLLTRLSKKKYTLCIMDTYAKSFLLRDNNDAVEVIRCLSPIYELTRGGDFTFGFIDHHRKNNQFSGDIIDDLSGSIAKGGVADTIWGLVGERGKMAAKLMIASRDTELDNIDLVFDADRTLWVEQSQEIVKPGTIQARILSYFGTNGTEVYIRTLAKKLGYDPSLISREMTELVKKGMVIRGEREIGNKVPFRLAPRRSIN